jgi:malonyl-ACP decarboxylase
VTPVTASDAPLTSSGPVAVTGLGVLTPAADGPEAFAESLHSPPHRPAGPLLGQFRAADWARRWLAEPEASAVAKIAARTALPAATACCVAAQALGGAGLGERDRDRTALIVAGNNLALDYQARTVLEYRDAPRSIRPSHALTCLDTDAVGAVSATTGVRGEGWTIGAASASGGLALIAAARLLLLGEADHCLVVAPAAELSAAEEAALRHAGALAGPGETCRPFDTGRSGFVRGQAAAAIVLERTADAERRGASVLARLTGYGLRLDGRRGTEPDPAGQSAAMTAALRRAGLVPRDIDYVNTHGTGSRAGDVSEATALRSVFGGGPTVPHVNATKALVGHCLSAAGLVEAVATVLQLRDGFVHANPNLWEPVDAGIGLVGRAAVSATLRTAVSNSFAFGGINVSVVLQTGSA